MRRRSDPFVVAVVAAAYGWLVVASIATYASDHATSYAWASPGAAASSLGRLAGLAAALLMTGLFVLVGRLPPLERVAGQDRLLRLHTAVAVALPCAVVVHASLVLLGGSALVAQPAFAYTQALVRSSLTVLVAIVAATLLVVVAVTSTRWLRGRLRYEWWHALHVTMYVALAGALLHQVVLGTDLLRHPGLRTMWVAAVAAVLASALAFRVVTPVVRSLAAGVRVVAVVQESPSTWSLLLAGGGLARRVGEGGVFCWLRVLRTGSWTQAHPFSVSGIDGAGQVRLSFAAAGDFTAALTRVRPGTRVVVEGPYGRFRASLATTGGPYLLVGVGSGAGAVVGVLAGLPAGRGGSVVLVQRVRHADDVPFADELRDEVAAGRLVHHVVSGPRTVARPRLDDAEDLRLLVPDVARREVYVCGPDELSRRVVSALERCGVPRRRVHVERFALGGRRVAAPAGGSVHGAVSVKPAAPAPRRP